MLDEEEPRLMASQVSRFAEIPDDVKLIISAELENGSTQKELGRIFSAYRGGNPVYLHLLGSKKIIRTEPGYWVDAKNPVLVAELKKLLGDNAVLM